MALKLKLENIDVSFTKEGPPYKTPDMEIKFANQIYNVEVTTINNPDEYKGKQVFYQKLIQLQVKHKVKTGGILFDIPKKKEYKLFQRIEERIIEIKERDAKGEVVVDGRLTVEIVPRLKNQKLTFQGFTFIHKELKNIEDKIIEVIKHKIKQLFVNPILQFFAFMGGSRSFNIEQLYSKTFDKIHFYLQTILNLSALVLSLYSDFYPMEPLKHLKSPIDSKAFFLLKPGFGETERSIIWKNKKASTEVPIPFLQTYENFENNVDKVLQKE
ncbi:MAG: hypothetical protein ACTSUR_03740 [Candidatus Heimdallarchaeaceae archaeon]